MMTYAPKASASEILKKHSPPKICTCLSTALLPEMLSSAAGNTLLFLSPFLASSQSGVSWAREGWGGVNQDKVTPSSG